MLFNFGIGLALISGVTMYYFRDFIAMFFTNIETIKELVVEAFKIVALCQVFDGS